MYQFDFPRKIQFAPASRVLQISETNISRLDEDNSRIFIPYGTFLAKITIIYLYVLPVIDTVELVTVEIVHFLNIFLFAPLK